MMPPTFAACRKQVRILHNSPKPSPTCRNKQRHRSGNVLVFCVVMMVVLFAFVALANDLGYLCVVRAQLQRAADSAALAGAAALYHPEGRLESQWYYLTPNPQAARLEARRFVQANPAAARSLDVDLNLSNIATGDVVVGRLYYPADRSELLDTAFDPPNTVRVQIPLTATHANGAVTLFFARVLGICHTDMLASAAATTWYPSLLPFATSVDNWENASAGGGEDNYAYRPGQGSFGVVDGSDGLPDVVMFPGPWETGDLPPGNFGLIQIGPDGTVLDTIRRQIDMGPSIADMESHGGELASGDHVPGRTGLKSSTKLAFLGGSVDGRTYGGILGRPRQLPLYETAIGNGNNAVFTISRFVAVRIMALRIDSRWRTAYQDTDGEDITAIMVQPLSNSRELVQVQLTR